MSLDADSYGTVAGVAAYVKRLTNSSGTFDATTHPTLTEVEEFINQTSDVLNGWLAKAGYVVPVTQVDAVRVLDRWSNLGSAGLVELSQRAGGYDAEDENRRENKFLRMFEAAEAYINSGALAQLGATVNADELPSPLSGLRVGGVTDSGQRLRPIFKRRGFGNNPTAESPAGREATYSGEP